MKKHFKGFSQILPTPLDKMFKTKAVPLPSAAVFYAAELSHKLAPNA